MCILLKLPCTKFDVSRFFYSKVIEEKLLGVGSTLNPLVKEGLSTKIYSNISKICQANAAPIRIQEKRYL